MDFELIFWLAIVVIYLIVQLRGAAKKQQRQRTSVPVPPDAAPTRTPSEAPTLEEALREIRQAMGLEEPPAEVLPPPVPSTPAPPKPKPQEPPDEFRPIPTHFADEAFEGRPTAFGPAHSIHGPAPTPRPALPKPRVVKAVPIPPSPPRSAAPDDISRKLYEPTTAREAFVLAEIFGPPRALRRR